MFSLALMPESYSPMHRASKTTDLSTVIAGLSGNFLYSECEASPVFKDIPLVPQIDSGSHDDVGRLTTQLHIPPLLTPAPV